MGSSRIVPGRLAATCNTMQQNGSLLKMKVVPAVDR
jgi:hypothetical protein